MKSRTHSKLCVIWSSLCSMYKVMCEITFDRCYSPFIRAWRQTLMLYKIKSLHTISHHSHLINQNSFFILCYILTRNVCHDLEEINEMLILKVQTCLSTFPVTIIPMLFCLYGLCCMIDLAVTYCCLPI